MELQSQSTSHFNEIEDNLFEISLDDYSNQEQDENVNIIISQNKQMAIEKIPHFLMHLNLITIDVNINNIVLKAMIDTGANCCVLYKKAVEKCKLEYLVDRSHISNVSAAQGTVNTYGKIWILDINIQNYSVPCSFDVIDNNDDDKFQIILGLNFLAANRIDIDFHSRKLIFSKNFHVPFNF